jgi:CRISPR-associated protein Cmr3
VKQIYSLAPLDTFFFRDFKELQAGEDNQAGGIFPPLPGTIYGALRSSYINEKGSMESFYNQTDTHLYFWMGSPDTYGDFSLNGVFISRQEKILLPVPLDYQIVSDEQNGVQKEYAYSLRLQEEGQDYQSSSRFSWHLYGDIDGKSASAVNAIVELDSWKELVLQKKQRVKIERINDCLVNESKIGIARDSSTKNVREGMLYNVDMKSFTIDTRGESEYRIVALAEKGPDFNEIRHLSCGWGGKKWELTSKEEDFTIFNEHEKAEIIYDIKASGIARIILLTPAIWSQGSLPGNYQDGYLYFKTKERKNQRNIIVELLTASIGRPLVIGGWDIASGRPKPKKYAVPAGSVLYVRVNPADTEDFVEIIESIKLTDSLEKEGYGFVVCAGYKI